MASTDAIAPTISLVVPVFNEAATLRQLWARLHPALQAMGETWEAIFVDDGSADDSFKILSELKDVQPGICVIRLRKNYGQHPATIAGFDHARGRWVLTMDADLQNDPADLTKILAKLREGYDVVSGVRDDRKDAFLRRKLPSRLVNRFIAKRTGFVQTDTGCFLKGYTLKAAQEIAEYTDIGGFITATISVLGYRYTEVLVLHHERLHGGSRYGILTQVDQFMSIFTGYARRPFQVIELIGGLVLLMGLAAAAAGLCGLLHPRAIHALLGMAIAVLGLLLGSVGIVGEYSVRLFKLSKRSPRYLVAEMKR
ncbi:MAG: glycosyltransferase family 2 protein [Verrucomicrobiae bacterium]|nr:glycosyltransferase family 2 protein [Verrucomicrobiae bacterium]